MADFSFEDVKNVVYEIAAEEGITNYDLNVNEDAFTGGNYTSRIVRSQIKEKDGDKREVNLLIKLTVMKEKGRDKIPLQIFFEAECNAYTFILPELLKYQRKYSLSPDKLIKFAKFYKGAYDYLKEYIIMEDLSCSGYELYGKDKPLDFEHSRIVMRTLANLHAVSFAMREKDPERFLRLRNSVAQQCHYPEIIFSMIKDTPSKIMSLIKSEERSKALHNLMEQRQSRILKCLDSSLTEPYNAISHGDVWNNNMLFRKQQGDSDCILVDYQIIRFSSPAIDIMYNFYFSTDGPFRDKYLKQLCEEYYSALGSNLREYGLDVTKIYPHDIFQKHLKMAISFGILMSFTSSVFIYGKKGEEKKLDEWIDDKVEYDYTVTESLVTRFEEFADDIIKYGCLDESSSSTL